MHEVNSIPSKYLMFPSINFEYRNPSFSVDFLPRRLPVCASSLKNGNVSKVNSSFLRKRATTSAWTLMSFHYRTCETPMKKGSFTKKSQKYERKYENYGHSLACLFPVVGCTQARQESRGAWRQWQTHEIASWKWEIRGLRKKNSLNLF